jgi:predicted nuclease with TOPRIM domain
MSKIQDRIQEIDKIAKRSRAIAIILSIVIIGFIVATGLNLQTISVTNAKLVENETVIQLKNDSLNDANEELVFLKTQIEANETKYKDELEELKSQMTSGNEELWEFTKSENTVNAYYKYIETKGVENIEPEKIDEIKTSILALMNKGADTKYWVQIKESNGIELFDKITMFGNIRDVRIAKSARSVRNGVIGVDSSSGRNGDVISKGQYVLVLDTKESGTTNWAQIRYSNKN